MTTICNLQLHTPVYTIDEQKRISHSKKKKKKVLQLCRYGYTEKINCCIYSIGFYKFKFRKGYWVLVSTIVTLCCHRQLEFWLVFSVYPLWRCQTLYHTKMSILLWLSKDNGFWWITIVLYSATLQGEENKYFRMISSFMRERETEIFVLLYHSKHTFNHLDFKTVLIDFFLLSTFLGFETV